jgi:uncharacterized membrane protein
MRVGREDSLRDPSAFHSPSGAVALARTFRRRRRLRAGIVQLLMAAVAVALGLTVPLLDVGFRIPSNRAVEMLIAVAAGTVTFIGLVFSLLFLVVQFSSTAFTPRLHLFRDAPVVWRSFALFTAVVVYSFTASLVVGRSETTPGLVPIVAFTGVLLSLLLYRRLQMTAFRSIQLASTLSEIAARAHAVLDGLYMESAARDRPPRPADPVPRDGDAIVWRGRPATLQAIDVPRLLAVAERGGASVRFRVGTGETIYEGTVLANVAGSSEGLGPAVLEALTVGEERTFEQDSAFPLRLLSDIALRALSPAVNDPTTAIQAIDATDGLLRVLAVRDLEIGDVTGGEGRVRVALVLPTWTDYLEVALADIVSLPSLAPSFRSRLLRMFDDLASIAHPERIPEIEAYRDQLGVPAGPNPTPG